VPRIRPQFLFLTSILIALAAAFPLFLNRRHDPQPQPTPPYSLVEPGLYIGGTVDAPPPGVRAVLCLSQVRDNFAAPVYEWQPIPDLPYNPPSLDWLRQQVAFIDAHRRAGSTIYVHCDSGISRSPMVAAAYLMWLHHWPRDRALQFLRAARPVVNPNPAFMDLLHDWEQILAPASVKN
jgi:protein-tyrosine phosphatase